jgi:hypothetical protein
MIEVFPGKACKQNKSDYTCSWSQCWSHFSNTMI